MADDSQDITDYRDAIEGMLLDGEELEAVFPGGHDSPNSDDRPSAFGVTSVRLIVCYRRLDRDRSDQWRFTSVLYARIHDVSLHREERFHRDRIDTSAEVVVYWSRQRGGDNQSIVLRSSDPAVAREAHDRILAHMLAAQ
jgi:hypothetical protein